MATQREMNMSTPENNSEESSEIDDLIDEVSNSLENFSFVQESEPSNLVSPPNSINLSLDDPLVLAVAEIEQYFWKNGELPSFTPLLEQGITVEEIKDVINPKLRGRGIPTYSFTRVLREFTPVGNKELDPLFVLTCNVMCKASSKSKGAKFKDLSTLGVNEAMWNAWLSIPSYFEYAKELMEIQFQTVTDVDAKMGIARNVANGDLQSIKYYHEFTNRYRPQDANAVNLMGLIGALMEILARNVTAEVFDRIAGELEQTPVGELMKAS